MGLHRRLVWTMTIVLLNGLLYGVVTSQEMTPKTLTLEERVLAAQLEHNKARDALISARQFHHSDANIKKLEAKYEQAQAKLEDVKNGVIFTTPPPLEKMVGHAPHMAPRPLVVVVTCGLVMVALWG